MSDVTNHSFAMKRTFLAQAWLSDNNVYVGYCPELDLFSQGETIDEALEAVIEAAHLYVKCVSERRARS